MADLTVETQGTVSQLLPQGMADTSQEAVRLSRYREQYVVNLYQKNYPFCREGSYFLAANPTIGTGLATVAAPTVFTATAPFILIVNKTNAAQPTPKYIEVDFVKLLATATGTGGTSLQYAVTVDGVARYASAGTLLTPVNAGGIADRGSIATVYAGPLVANAAGPNVRQVAGTRVLKRAIPALLDQYLINFGNIEGYRLVGLDTVDSAPPFVIGPGETGMVHLFLPAQSVASSYEVEVGWIER